MRAFSLLLSVVVLALVACRGAAGSVPPAQGVTRPAPTATNTPRPLPTATATLSLPTATLAEPTPKPTATRRPTSTPSPTPLPTIPPEQIPTVIAGLDGALSDCPLPCWWGMTPGLSAWADFQPFLQSIASVSQERRHNPQAIYHVVEANLPVRDTTLMDTGVISVVAGTIDSIMTGGSNDVQRLRLPDFLVANGKPDEVWLSTFSAVPEGEPPFRLILLYHRGIVARFELAEVPIIGGNIIGCYGRGSAYYVLVWLVSPDQQVSFQQALESSELLDPIQPYQRLEEATDLDVDAFFEEFTRNDRACLETPEGRW